MVVECVRMIEEFDGFFGLGIFFEFVEQGLVFVLCLIDVVILLYGKCGMIWLQQMVYMLCIGGDMDFDDILCVVFWIEMLIGFGFDFDVEQWVELCVFKSYLFWGFML